MGHPRALGEKGQGWAGSPDCEWAPKARWAPRAAELGLPVPWARPSLPGGPAQLGGGCPGCGLPPRCLPGRALRSLAPQPLAWGPQGEICRPPVRPGQPGSETRRPAAPQAPLCSGAGPGPGLQPLAFRSPSAGHFPPGPLGCWRVRPGRLGRGQSRALAWLCPAVPLGTTFPFGSCFNERLSCRCRVHGGEAR